MGYAQHVGRIGALAVALGVTNAVGHPLIAWADEPSAESSTTGGDSAPSTGTPEKPTTAPDKPTETQAADPTTAPTQDPVDTEEAAPDIETPEAETPEVEVSEVETPDPTTTPTPETAETPAPEPDPETTDPHPSEVEQPPVAVAPPAEDTGDDDPETTDQNRFVVHALAVSGLDEESLDAPLPMALAIPVSADLITSSAAPSAAVTITKVDPATVEEIHPFRSLVLGVLGIFGFDPTPGATNDALLTALWAAYRGYERRYENESPTVGNATVIDTSQTADGYTAVRFSVAITDPDGDTLHITTTNGTAGTLTNNNDGTYTYTTLTPGVDTVTITANDDDGTHIHGLLGWLFKPNGGHTRTVTLNLNITAPPANHAPVAGDDTAGTNEDTPVVIHVLTNDSDADGDPLTVAALTSTTHGTLTVNSDGTFGYTPDENYHGTDEFTYIVSDGTLTDTASVTITVNAVNDAPVAEADTRSVAAGSSYTFTAAQLLGNDTDADGDTLALHGVGNPTGGTVVLNGNGTVTFTPTATGGSGSFTYTNADTAGAVSAAATVTIVVSTDPVAVDSIPTSTSIRTTWITFTEDGTYAYTANRGNNTISVYDTATRTKITDIELPAGSEPLHINTGPDGKIYVANRAAGNVTVIDPTTNSIVQTISTGGRPLGVNFHDGIAYVTLGDANGVKAYDIDNSYALVQTYTQGTDGWPSRTAVTPEGRLYISNQITNSVSVVDRTTGDLITTITGIGFATDIELDEADHLAFVSGQTANQVAVIDTRTDTLLRYITTGTTPIGLQVDDATNTGYVVNFNGGYEGAENPGNVWVLDLATGQAIAQIPVGTGAVSATLTPDHRQLWVASEGTGITIIDLPAATNRSPIAVGDSVTTDEDTPVVIHVLTNDSDPDGDPLSIAGHGMAGHGTVTLNADGTFTYAPDENYYGTDEFSYSVTDGTASSYATAVHITVDPSNHDPVITDSDAGQADPATGVIIGQVTASDIDGDTLTYGGTTLTAHGSVTVNPDGTFIYTPTPEARHDAAADGAGIVTDSFTVTVSDGHGGLATAPLTVTVEPQNNAPTFVSGPAIMTLDPATTWPAKIIFSPDGSRAYTVITSGGYDAETDTDTTSYSLAVIDTSTNAATIIPLSGYINAGSLTVSPNGAWVFTYGASNDEFNTYSLTVLDTASNTVSTIPFPGYVYNPPLDIPVSPDGSHVYLNSLDSTTYRYVTNVFDLAAHSVTSVTLPAHTSPGTSSFNFDGSKVYLTTGGDYTTGYQQALWQIDSGTGAANSITLPGYPQTLTFSADGTRAYATFVSNSTCDNGNCQLAVIDTATLTATWITVPAISRSMVVSADNRYVYATGSDDTLMVVDTATHAVTSIALDGSVAMQFLLAVVPDGNTAYAVTGSGQYSNYNWENNALEIIDLADQTVTVIPLASKPNQLAVSPDGTFVYLQDNDPATGHSTVLLIDTATNTPTSVPTDGHGSWLTVRANSRLLTEVRLIDSEQGSTAVLVAIDTGTKTATTVPLPGAVGPFALTEDGLHVYAWTHVDDDAYTMIVVSLAPTGPGDPDQTTGVVTGTLTATDVDGDHLTYALAADGSFGNATVHPDGTFSYMPTPEARQNAAADGSTTDSFTVTVVDGHGGSAQTSVTVTVAPVVVAPPQAGADTAETNEDTPVNVAVLANDTGSGSLSVIAVSQPDHGHAVNSNGVITYTPATDFNGEDTFTYTVSNGTLTDTATVTVTVNSVQDAPLIQSIVTTAVSATSWRITVTAYDPDGDQLNITLTPDDPEHVTITPVANLLSARMFGIAAFDAGPTPTTVEHEATVDPEYALEHPGEPMGFSTSVSDPDNPPVVEQKLLGTISNLLGVGDSANSGQFDIPAAPAGLHYTNAYVGMFETLMLLSDGTVVAYGNNSDGRLDIPDLPDGVTYTGASAGWFNNLLLRSDGQVVVVGQQITVPELADGVTYTGVATGSGNFPTDRRALLLRSDGTAVLVKNSNSTIEILVAGPGMTYTQASAGTGTFALLRSDGRAFLLNSETGAVSALPDPTSGGYYTQVAAGQTFGQPFTVLLQSDGTAVGFGTNSIGQLDIPELPDGLTYTSVAAGAGFTVLLRSDGAVVTLGHSLTGVGGGDPSVATPVLPDGIIFTHAWAGWNGSLFATATDTGPRAGADAVGTDEDTAVSIDVADLLINDTDPDGDILTIIGVGQGAHGAVVLNGGTVAYTPATDFNGEDTFTYTVTDGTTPHLGSVTVSIDPVDDAPVIQSVVSTPLSTTSWRITVTAYDPDGDPLNITLTPDDPEHVTITPVVNLLSARMFSFAALDAGPTPTTVEFLGEVDPEYAQTHPGAPVGGTVGVTDGNSPAVTQQRQVATITNMVGFGDRNGYGLVDIPAAPDGLSYTKIAVGLANSVALLSDGTAALYGITAGGMFEIPALPENVTYTDAAYPDIWTVFLLRSDGAIVAAGSQDPLSRIPAAPDGVTYTGIVGTVGYAALMRSDGDVTLINVVDSEVTEPQILTAGDGLIFVQAAVASDHIVLLRSNGTVVAYPTPTAFMPPPDYGQLNIPVLPDAMTYTQVAAGNGFTVLLRSDGTALTFGKKETNYTDIPPLPPGMTYTQIGASDNSAVGFALRSDGALVSFGSNSAQTAIPDLPAGVVYTHIYAGLDGAAVAATAHTTGLSAGPDRAP